jgi:hypothetical protein
MWAYTVDLGYDGSTAETFSWTTELPTVEGWYWVRNIKGVIWCEEVFVKDGVSCWMHDEDAEYNPIKLDYFTHWLGPIPPPEPPEKASDE